MDNTGTRWNLRFVMVSPEVLFPTGFPAPCIIPPGRNPKEMQMELDLSDAVDAPSSPAPLVFELPFSMLEKLVEWQTYHQRLAEAAARDGQEPDYPSYSYIFTPTGIGVACQARNNKDGSTLDLTDYGSW